jgi:tetratricopeptide (TPR) repeat protein
MKLEECYRSLGLKPGASRAQIKIAYRSLARQFHPDTGTQQNAAQHEIFLRITAAYKSLLQSFPVEHNAPIRPHPSTPEALLKHQAYPRLRQLFADKRFAGAITLVEALADRLPEDLEVQQWRAIAYQHQGRHLVQARQYPQAMRYLQKALTTNPTNRTLVATIHQDLKALQRLIKQVEARSL